ncbi:MAG TPA: GerMN domain-containing protein [Acidimicrobiales bacterium]|nr:GerMN domain-containing protein [Acidimicrobiales bacterium]
MTPARHRLLLAGLGVGLSLAATACAVPDQRSPVVIQGAGLPSTPSTVAGYVTVPGYRIAVYFVGSNNTLVGVPRSDPTGLVTVAMTDLLAGPSRQEAAGGTSSAVPSGTKLLSAKTSAGTAYLNFSSPLTGVTGHEELLAFAQIVVTAGSTPGVDSVQIAVEGKPVNAPMPDGTLAQRPVTKADYSSLLSRSGPGLAAG